MFIVKDLLVSLSRPLAKLCVRSGVRIVELYPALKKAFVLCACEELSKAGHKINTSRISLMTGIQRPEIDNFLKEPEIKPKSSLITSLIGLWTYHPKFIQENGKPRVLSYDGPKSDFARLVKMTSKEHNPNSVLFELERSGFVEKSEQTIRLKSSLNLQKEASEGLAALAKDSEDLSNSIWNNVTTKDTLKDLHIRLDLDKIPSEKIDEVKNLILKLGQEAIAKIQKSLAYYDQDFNSDMHSEAGSFHSISVTIFSATKKNLLEGGHEQIHNLTSS